MYQQVLNLRKGVGHPFVEPQLGVGDDGVLTGNFSQKAGIVIFFLLAQGECRCLLVQRVPYIFSVNLVLSRFTMSCSVGLSFGSCHLKRCCMT